MNISRNQSRQKRHNRIKSKIKGTAEKPRLNVFFSLRYVYAQAIDDDSNQIIAEANSRKITKKDSKTTLAEKIGTLLAEKCLKKGIKKIVFDRGGYKYHGRVKALADSARQAGLEF